MNLSELQRLFAYDDWANRETLASLRVPSPPARAQKFLAHILGAEWLWMVRLTGERRQVVVWPELSLAQCAEEIERLSAAWRSYLETLTPAALDRPVSYTNSKGEPWTSSVGDILLHVVMHSGYHRGQIATEVRAAGHAPAYTDYIHAVRTGRVT
jgi:uncharacterized damage-inducible protein DinB